MYFKSKWNSDKCWCECGNPKEHHVCKKDSIWNATTCECKNEKHLARMIDESVITFDEIINAVAKFSDKETKTIPTKTILAKSSSTFFLFFTSLFINCHSTLIKTKTFIAISHNK